jgi:hypothetical protein
VNAPAHAGGGGRATTDPSAGKASQENQGADSTDTTTRHLMALSSVARVQRKTPRVRGTRPFVPLRAYLLVTEDGHLGGRRQVAGPVRRLATPDSHIQFEVRVAGSEAAVNDRYASGVRHGPATEERHQRPPRGRRLTGQTALRVPISVR